MLGSAHRSFVDGPELDGVVKNAWKYIGLLIGLVFCSGLLMAQPADRRISKEEYIDTYKETAIREMHASGIPASITMAQGILESDYGNSPLARYANNHFGIKCHKSWTGPGFYQDDDEANECFRKYYNADESYKDHSEFLKTRSRYAFLFELKLTDYKGWAKGLKKAGYATNPKYPDLLIRVIEDNELYKLDEIKKMPATASKRPEKKKTNPPAVPKTKVSVHANNIKFVLAEAGDTQEELAERHKRGLWEIRKYNDFQKGDVVTAGEVIYLQPKRRNAKEDYHTVVKGETLREIAQAYGIKLKYLRKYNDLAPEAEATTGKQLALNAKVARKKG